MIFNKFFSFATLLFAILLCSAGHAQDHCEGLLQIHTDYFGERVVVSSGSGVQTLRSGDALEITYKNGTTERVIVHSEFPGKGRSGGHGEPEYVKQQVFIPVTTPDGIRVILVNTTVINQITSVKYLGNVGEN